MFDIYKIPEHKEDTSIHVVQEQALSFEKNIYIGS